MKLMNLMAFALLSSTALAVNEPFVLHPYTGTATLDSVNLKRDVCYVSVSIDDPDKVFGDAYKVGLDLETGLTETNERLGAPLSSHASTLNLAPDSCFLSYSAWITLQKTDGRVLFALQETLTAEGDKALLIAGRPAPLPLSGTVPLYATSLFGLTDADPVALQARLAQAVQFAFTSSFGR